MKFSELKVGEKFLFQPFSNIGVILEKIEPIWRYHLDFGGYFATAFGKSLWGKSTVFYNLCDSTEVNRL